MSAAKLATAISEEDHTQGPADATITLVQYGDYADLRIMPTSAAIPDQRRLKLSA